ncbi:MAG: hydantoinase/oxoprolinase family protein [Kiloniellales bacterium]|nr:hydantoinase/oxoprolinase family protein [Kiloniellales bacterium]
MPLRLGIDTGGTYTDAVLFDEDRGVVAAAKALTTKHDLAIGVAEAMTGVLARAEEEIAMVALSTTLATNALVEGHGSPVCLLLAGFDAESLERSGLGRAMAGDPVVFLQGGHQPSGDAQGPLDLAAAEAAIAAHAPKAAAFAVAGYFGVRNPAHEIALRDLVRERTGLPVTCSHQLTSKLDAPRRAMTTVLNARLIALLQQLILAVQDQLAEAGIEAPLMVVKADGSLIAAAAALERPIETILSGPAASLIGAQALCGAGDVVVSDMGGTTTDIAVLADGQPALSPDGAQVGGWRTMVEAVSVHTLGIGGDSEVRLDERGALLVGPRRAVPLALLAQDNGAVLEALRRQAADGASGLAFKDALAGRFALRLRALDTEAGSLSSGEREIWRRLEAGPVALEELLANSYLKAPLDRLTDRGLVILSAFTPSDAAHLLGLHAQWNAEAARLGAAIWLWRLGRSRLESFADPEAFARRVFDQVLVQSGRALVGAALAEAGEPGLDDAGLVERALMAPERKARGGVDFAVKLGRPVVAVGAPAATYYGALADRLDTEIIVPPHAEVANAVGAVAAGVVQRVEALITSPEEGRYRVHLSSGLRDFGQLEGATAYAVEEARRLAGAAAERAGAARSEVKIARKDVVAEAADGREVFFETRITATAFGRPALAS